MYVVFIGMILVHHSNAVEYVSESARHNTRLYTHNKTLITNNDNDDGDNDTVRLFQVRWWCMFCRRWCSRTQTTTAHHNTHSQWDTTTTMVINTVCVTHCCLSGEEGADERLCGSVVHVFLFRILHTGVFSKVYQTLIFVLFVT